MVDRGEDPHESQENGRVQKKKFKDPTVEKRHFKRQLPTYKAFGPLTFF
jgi:hypothetical protein